MKTEILAPSEENLKRAARDLLAGEIGAVPTETVYGLAGVFSEEVTLAKIFQAKERPVFDPLIIHVAWTIDASTRKNRYDLGHLEELGLVDSTRLFLPARHRLENLMEAFWPGPLTLVLPKTTAVPDLATAGLGTVAVRMPRHPVMQALIHAVGKPLAAPSANRFGRISPTSASDVKKELDGRIPWVLDGGSCEIGLESTVVRIENDGQLMLLRPGAVTVSELERAWGNPILHPLPSLGSSKPQAAPGMLESHYAPSKSLRMLEGPVEGILHHPAHSWKAHKKGVTCGFLVVQGDEKSLTERLTEHLKVSCEVRVLCPTATLGSPIDWTLAAQRFFAQLRSLDESQAGQLFAEPIPEESGLGFAIADRLRKASAREA